jgi:hypothetical protein
MSDHFLLLETGDKLLLETGDKLILEPETVLGDLTFLPTYPDRVPHLRVTRETTWVTSAAVSVPKTVPPPDLLATMDWFPCYPDRVPHRRSLIREPAGTMDAALAFAATETVTWLPVYPDQVPRRRLSTAARAQFFTAPSPDAQVVAQQLGWLPVFPSRVPHRVVYRPTGGFIWTIPPEIPAGGVPCLDLGLEGVVSTTLTPEVIGFSDLIEEGLDFTTLLGEDVC